MSIRPSFLLKTHFSQSQKPMGPMSTTTLGTNCNEVLPTESRGVQPHIYHGSAITSQDSKMWYLVRPIKTVPRWAWTFGFPFITGTIHFESHCSQDQYHFYPIHDSSTPEDDHESDNPTVWATFALPQWLSYRVLEVVAQRSRIGWRQYIRVRNIFPRLDDTPGTPFHLACEHIALGELQDLKRKLDEREVTPWDEDGRGETMWIVSSTDPYH